MKSFPFDSEVTYGESGEPIYDRASKSQDLRDYFSLMYTDGVFPNPSTGLQVTTSTQSMSVTVKPGAAIIQGAFAIEDRDRTIVFEAADENMDRIDSVVIRLNTNLNYRTIDLYVVKGKAAAQPAAPALTREGGIYELRLANVFVAKGTTTISKARITDTRLNSRDCGIAACNPQKVETSAIYDQYQASLDEWLQYVADCIDGTTAGNLQKQISALNAKVPFGFGVDQEGNAGYIKPGEDHITLFGSGTVNLQTASIDHQSGNTATILIASKGTAHMQLIVHRTVDASFPAQTYTVEKNDTVIKTETISGPNQTKTIDISAEVNVGDVITFTSTSGSYLYVFASLYVETAASGTGGAPVYNVVLERLQETEDKANEASEKAAQIDSVKEDLAEVDSRLSESIHEISNGDLKWVNGYYAILDGHIVYDSTYRRTEYFPVEYEYLFKMPLTEYAVGNNLIALKNNGEYVGCIRNGYYQSNSGGAIHIVDYVEHDEFAIMYYGEEYEDFKFKTYVTTQKEVTELEKGKVADVSAIADYAYNKTIEIESVLGSKTVRYDADAFTVEAIPLANGTTRTFGGGWLCTDFIPCNGRTIEYKCRAFSNGTREDYNIAFISFYDETKNFVSCLKSSENLPNGIKTGTIKAPENAFFVKGVKSSEVTDAFIEVKGDGFINDMPKLQKNNVNSLNIFCIGDSLTRGVIDSDVHIIKESYPYWVGDILSSNVVNAGYPGGKSDTWWNTKRTTYGTPTPDTDVVLIMFGTNGGLETNTLATDVEPYTNYNNYADTAVGDYCKIIEWIREITNNHAQIILMTPPVNWVTTGTEAYAQNKYNVVLQSNAVVKAIAQRYSLPVIDVFYESGMDKFNGSTFRPDDGMHFNAKGYHKLGSFVARKIESMYSTFDVDETGTII